MGNSHRWRRRSIARFTAVAVMMGVTVTFAFMLIHGRVQGKTVAQGTTVAQGSDGAEGSVVDATADQKGSGGFHGPAGQGSGKAVPTSAAATLPPAPACTSTDFTRTLSTDKPQYHASDTVWVRFDTTYNGARCAFAGDCVPFGLVRDGSQHEILTTMTPNPCGRLDPVTLKKGDTIVEEYPWDQQPLNAQGTATTGEEVPRGTYTITGDWHTLGLTNTVTVQLVS